MLGQSALRSGCQWFNLQVSGDGQSLSLAAFGRVYDGSTSYPYYYYMPSLIVNTNGDMVTGFSGSKTNEYIGAFYVGRLADGTTSSSPTLVQAGRASFGGGAYWGDYSYTSLDPVDGSFWTVQEYAESLIGDNRGTWVTKINH